MMRDDSLTPETILDRLGTTTVPRSVRCYDEVSSTMDVARAHLPQTSTDNVPMLILADYQSAGRGRMQRPWLAPPATALMFSLILRPHWLQSEQATALVWMMGVALCETIAEQTGLTPVLKWPNDVLLPGAAPYSDAPEPPPAKIAGILVESGSALKQLPSGALVSYLDWAIIGCGLNVSASPPATAPLRYPATNLTTAAGRPVPRLPLLRELLIRLDSWYQALQQGDYTRLFTTWYSLLYTLGRTVEVQTADGPLTGYAEDVDTSGALLLRDATGQLHTITNGDI